MSVRRRTFAAATAALLVAALSTACGSDGAGSGGSASGSPLHVGIVVAQTGYLGGVDPHYLKGVQLAADKLNAAGGADGHKIELHVYDNASTATTGVTMVNQALNQAKSTVLITGALSAQASAVAPILAGRKTPNLTLAQLPSDPSWTFSTTDSYKLVADTALTYLAALKVKSIAVLVSQTPYGQLASEYVKQQAPGKNINIVLSDSVAATATDLTAQMSKVKSAGPDAVLDFLTGGIHVVEAKGAAAVGLTVPIVMGEDDVKTFKSVAGDYSNATFIAPPPQLYPDIPNKAQSDLTGPFVTAYKADHPDLTGISFAAQGYDAMMNLAAVVKSSKATGGDTLRTALESFKADGVSGPRKYSPSDHFGQSLEDSQLAVAKISGDAVARVYPAP